MIPGKPRLHPCPQCSQLVAQPTLISGNTFGATLWSDGKREAPMLPHYPDLQKCPKCQTLFLASRARDGGEGDFSSRQSAELSETDWLRALESGLFALDLANGFDDLTRYGRVNAWHAANDFCRADHAPACEFSSAQIENLRALSTLLEAGPEHIGDLVDEDTARLRESDALLRAEIDRELGEFDQAREILESVRGGELEDIKSQLLEWTNDGDARVRRFDW